MATTREKKEELKKKGSTLVSGQEGGLQELREGRKATGRWNTEDLEKIESLIGLAPESKFAPSLLFIKGNILADLKEFEECEKIGNHTVEKFPGRPEGSFILAACLIGQGKKTEAVKFANKGKVEDASLPAESEPMDDFVLECIHKMFNQLSHHIKVNKRDEIVAAMKDHAERFDAYTGGACGRCHTVYDTPTPQWMCIKCWPLKEQLVWQPDGFPCRVCKQAVGMFSGRHHCRCCGKVVCGKCSDKTRASVGLLNYLDRVRVCTICHSRIKEESTRTMSSGMNSAIIPNPQ